MRGWMLVAVVAVVVPLVSGFTPNALAISSSLTARPYQNIVLRSKRTSLLSVGTRNRNKGALGLTAGLDPGTPMPNLDALYFGGVLICWVGGGLLFIQTYGGKVGLGNFLKSSTGPGSDSKNWERMSGRAAEENKMKLNTENKGNWLANLLPKLDFVEVYGQDKPAPKGLSELEQIVAKEGGEELRKMVAELELELTQAVEANDFEKAANIQSKLKEIK